MAATEASPVGRAGRNLPMAVAVGVALAALVLICLYTYSWLFVVLAASAIPIAVYEVITALHAADYDVPRMVALVGSAVMLVAAYAKGSEALLVAFVLTLLAIVLIRLAGSKARLSADLDASVLVMIWVPLLAAFAMLMLAQPQGPDRVLVFILLVVMSDTGGFLAGVMFGRHRMTPNVSPKKSWEGFGGSVLLCAVVGSAAVSVLLSGQWWQGALLGIVVAVCATLGDLGESLIKRDLGLKDMGTILPGHGGLMDRLDSLLPTAPVAFVVLSWVLS